MEIVDELPDYSVPDAVDPLLVAPQPKKARRRKRKKAPAKRRGDKGKGCAGARAREGIFSFLTRRQRGAPRVHGH